MTATNVEVDRVLSDSFPASDPPPWVPSHVLGAGFPVQVAAEAVHPQVAERPEVTPPEPATRRALRHLRSAALAVGVVMLLPVFVLVLPIALVARGLMDVGGWRFAWK